MNSMERYDDNRVNRNTEANYRRQGDPGSDDTMIDPGRAMGVVRYEAAEAAAHFANVSRLASREGNGGVSQTNVEQDAVPTGAGNPRTWDGHHAAMSNVQAHRDQPQPPRDPNFDGCRGNFLPVIAASDAHESSKLCWTCGFPGHTKRHCSLRVGDKNQNVDGGSKNEKKKKNSKNQATDAERAARMKRIVCPYFALDNNCRFGDDCRWSHLQLDPVVQPLMLQDAGAGVGPSDRWSESAMHQERARNETVPGVLAQANAHVKSKFPPHQYQDTGAGFISRSTPTAIHREIAPPLALPSGSMIPYSVGAWKTRELLRSTKNTRTGGPGPLADGPPLAAPPQMFTTTPLRATADEFQPARRHRQRAVIRTPDQVARHEAWEQRQAAETSKRKACEAVANMPGDERPTKRLFITTVQADGSGHRKRVEITGQIFVRTLSGSTITLSINLDLSISDVKFMIQDRLGIPPSDQRLVCCGKQLQDDNTLRDYNIHNEATLHLAMRLCGGGQDDDIKAPPLEPFDGKEENYSKWRIYGLEAYLATTSATAILSFPMDKDQYRLVADPMPQQWVAQAPGHAVCGEASCQIHQGVAYHTTLDTTKEGKEKTRKAALDKRVGAILRKRLAAGTASHLTTEEWDEGRGSAIIRRLDFRYRDATKRAYETRVQEVQADQSRLGNSTTRPDGEVAERFTEEPPRVEETGSSEPPTAIA